MDFKEFYAQLSKAEKEKLAAKADTSPAYLSQIASGFRNAGMKTIRNLIKADKRITLQMFEPDLVS